MRSESEPQSPLRLRTQKQVSSLYFVANVPRDDDAFLRTHLRQDGPTTIELYKQKRKVAHATPSSSGTDNG